MPTYGKEFILFMEINFLDKLYNNWIFGISDKKMYWKMLPEDKEVIQKWKQGETVIINCIDYNEEIIGKIKIKVEKILWS